MGRVINPIAATILSLATAYCTSLLILGLFVRKKVRFTIPLRELLVNVILGFLLCLILLIIGRLELSATVTGSIASLAFGSVLFVLFSYILSKTLSKMYLRLDGSPGKHCDVYVTDESVPV